MERIRSHPRLIMAGALLLILTGLLALTAAGALAHQATPSDGYQLTWDVVSSGGATLSSTHFRMQSTTGQALTGQSASAHVDLNSGYWYGFQDVLRRIFMPILNRNH